MLDQNNDSSKTAAARDNFFTLILKYLLPAPWIDYLEHLEDFYPIGFFENFLIIRKRILSLVRLEPLTLRVETYRSTNWAIKAIYII